MSEKNPLSPSVAALKASILRHRQETYVTAQGGWTFPLAGCLWWAGFAALGWFGDLPLKTWTLYAFIGSGMIFPLALLLSAVFGVKAFTTRSAVETLMAPVFIGMLMFWPMAFAAFYTEISLAPVIVAIGMAMHWPAIGWTYGRSALFSAHAIARALSALAIFLLAPDKITTWLPASVAILYAITIAAILIDVQTVKRRLAQEPQTP